MKFHWGTGILIFLILFLIAAGFFIGFAVKQDVSLVHQDYYERGVDHSAQMEVEARSVPYSEFIRTGVADGNFLVEVEPSLASEMDSATIQLYRPSDSDLDLTKPFHADENPQFIPLNSLVPGRYILHVYWTNGGLKYEVEKTVIIR